MRDRSLILLLAMAAALGSFPLPTRASDVPPVSPESLAFFEAKVRPVLVQSCQKCHGPTKQTSDLRLDSREAILKGGASGPAVVPGDPDASLLIQAVRHAIEDIQMPPKGKLPNEAIGALVDWVAMGAPWPESASTAKSAVDPGRDHWAFQPLKPVSPPEPRDRNAPRTPIDAFLLERLEAQGLGFSPEADRRTLIRRLAFDLTGLPPSPEEVEAFQADPNPDAFERVVDRLLASPGYGERWGRHWLDVARYGDTKGYVFNEERRYPYSHTYRDYVIRAFNEDKPYDQFLREQIAADRLADRPGADPGALAALGFLTVGRRFLNDQNDVIDDRIDVVTRGLLGLTVTCARCHDHKYDPIPTEDYYSLHGVFASTIEPAELPEIPGAVPAELARDFAEKLAAKQKELDAFNLAKRLEIEGDYRARATIYLKAALALNFDGRNRKLDDRARADGLNPSRLRGISGRWKAHLDASKTSSDPIMAPWHAFAALPPGDFSRRAPGLAKSFEAAGDPNIFHPVVARAFAANPPGSMEEVASTYGGLITEADRLAKEAGPGKPLDDPARESLRQYLQAESGPFHVSEEALPRTVDRAERNEIGKRANAIKNLQATHPGAAPRAMAVADAPAPVEPRVYLKGNPGRPGPVVPRRFLKLLDGPDRKPFSDGSGRKELAEAITRPDNPLTPRVLVNRVWLQHFGAGLVTSPSDFGTRSDPPSHPELLDWLAADFVARGWSIKQLHRRIVLSTAYRQQSMSRSESSAIDPENRLLWKMNRRRLDFEAMRDALLAVSGGLDPKMGGRGEPLFEAPFPPRRTVYGFIDRQNLNGVYRSFDFASPDSSSPGRFSTTVPQQALFLMNSPFVVSQAKALADRLEASATDDPKRLAALYRLVLNRPPDPRETALGLAFINRWNDPDTKTGAEASGLSPWGAYAQALLLTNEFQFVD